MRISLLVLIVNLTLLSVCLARNADAQELLETKIDIQLTKVTYQEMLSAIEKTAGVHFVYRTNIFDGNKINVVSKQEKLSALLNRVLSSQNIQYKISHDNFIILTKGNTTDSSLISPEKRTGYQAAKNIADTLVIIQGKVTSKTVPVSGASVLIEGTSQGVTTDDNGNFVLHNVSNGSYTLLISHVSYSRLKEKVTVNGQDLSLTIEMPEDPLQLQQVIVTSTGSPKKKIESSVAITTVSSATLEDRAPQNAAEVIKAVPGVFVNSSGGDGPGNAFVRGIPSGGGYQYFGVMEDGLPLLPTGFNSYPSVDQNFKTDLTIKTIEAIRGGNAPLVMVNTAGALMNILSYTGAEKTYGKFKFTSGLSQEMFRVDGNLGGSLSKKVKYDIGGFYRTDKGIRPPTYTANKGGQLKANLTWNFNTQGYIRVYGKYLNDKVQWQLPGIYAYNTAHKVEPFQGFDMYKETMVPSETVFDLKMPEGNIHQTNLEEGYHTKLAYGGFLFNYRINGWTIKNNFRYQYNDILATYPTVTSFVAFSPAKSYYTTDGKQFLDTSGYYATQQLMDGRRLESQVIDYLDLTKQLGKHNLTIGGGIYSYNVIKNETINSVIASEIKNQPKVILVGSPTASPATPASNTNAQGHVKNNGVTNMSSVYVMDEFALSDKLRLEAGARFDFFSLNGEKGVYSGSSTATGGPGFSVTGMTPWSEKKNYWSASVAANYKVNNSLAFFIRGTRAYNAFMYTDYTALDYDPAKLKDRQILMAELGAKYAGSSVAVFSSVSYTTTRNLPQGVVYPTATGSLVGQSAFSSARTISWETEATYRATKSLNLRLTMTLQNPVFTDYAFSVDSNARPDIAGRELNWKGNKPQNTPSANIQLGATYDFSIFSFFGTAIYQGAFWSTSANTYKIPAYTDVIAGVSARFLHRKAEIRLWANNLLDTRALTAGNVRGEQFINEKNLVVGQPMIGRPTTPRNFWVSLAYEF